MNRLIGLGILLLFLVACGGNDAGNDQLPPVDKEMQENRQLAEDEMAKRAEKNDEDMKLVNFKCVMADIQEYYFFEDKIKIKSPASEGWLIDNVYYVVADVDGEEYLVTGMMDTDITAEDLKNMYMTSKATPNFDCDLGGASEADVTLPDLPVITNEELTQKMFESMGVQ